MLEIGKLRMIIKVLEIIVLYSDDVFAVRYIDH